MSKKPLKKLSYDDKLKAIKNNNGFQYDAMKAVEELTELSAAIMQALTKRNKDAHKDIIEEFGDVDFRLGVLRNYFDSKAIVKRKRFKINKSIGYLKTQKYGKI